MLLVQTCYFYNAQPTSAWTVNSRGFPRIKPQFDFNAGSYYLIIVNLLILIVEYKVLTATEIGPGGMKISGNESEDILVKGLRRVHTLVSKVLAKSLGRLLTLSIQALIRCAERITGSDLSSSVILMHCVCTFQLLLLGMRQANVQR